MALVRALVQLLGTALVRVCTFPRLRGPGRALVPEPLPEPPRGPAYRRGRASPREPGRV